MLYPVGTDFAETGASVIQPQLDERMNVDDAAPMLKEGARVTDRYDNSIGNVTSLTLDEQSRVTALTVKEGFLFTHQTSIPMAWVDDINDNTVVLKNAKEE